MSGPDWPALSQLGGVPTSPQLPCFPRNKTGILGWRSEKTEMVNGYEAKVRHQFLGPKPSHPLAHSKLGRGF